jgi:hypothetical protein
MDRRFYAYCHTVDGGRRKRLRAEFRSAAIRAAWDWYARLRQPDFRTFRVAEQIGFTEVAYWDLFIYCWSDETAPSEKEQLAEDLYAWEAACKLEKLEGQSDYIGRRDQIQDLRDDLHAYHSRVALRSNRPSALTAVFDPLEYDDAPPAGVATLKQDGVRAAPEARRRAEAARAQVEKLKRDQ